jgi:hypothetical protein
MPQVNVKSMTLKDGYEVIFTSENYDEAKLWLSEDEYEPIEGRLLSEDLWS